MAVTLVTGVVVAVPVKDITETDVTSVGLTSGKIPGLGLLRERLPTVIRVTGLAAAVVVLATGETGMAIRVLRLVPPITSVTSDEVLRLPLQVAKKTPVPRLRLVTADRRLGLNTTRRRTTPTDEEAVVVRGAVRNTRRVPLPGQEGTQVDVLVRLDAEDDVQGRDADVIRQAAATGHLVVRPAVTRLGGVRPVPTDALLVMRRLTKSPVLLPVLTSVTPDRAGVVLVRETQDGHDRVTAATTTLLHVGLRLEGRRPRLTTLLVDLPSRRLAPVPLGPDARLVLPRAAPSPTLPGLATGTG